jgi:hypothetical protein
MYVSSTFLAQNPDGENHEYSPPINYSHYTSTRYNFLHTCDPKVFRNLGLRWPVCNNGENQRAGSIQFKKGRIDGAARYSQTSIVRAGNPLAGVEQVHYYRAIPTRAEVLYRPRGIENGGEQPWVRTTLSPV